MWVDRAEDWDGAEDDDVVTYRDREPAYQRGIVYYLRGDKVGEGTNELMNRLIGDS